MATSRRSVRATRPVAIAETLTPMRLIDAPVTGSGPTDPGVADRDGRAHLGVTAQRTPPESRWRRRGRGSSMSVAHGECRSSGPAMSAHGCLNARLQPQRPRASKPVMSPLMTLHPSTVARCQDGSRPVCGAHPLLGGCDYSHAERCNLFMSANEPGQRQT
jgi:hypothetical protein